MALSRSRALLVLFVALAMSIPVLPVQADGGRRDAASARAVVDDGINLVVPEGASYNLSGSHIYSGKVWINGTLKVDPWDGVNETSGMLSISASSIFIGPSGGIFADGRGYGGGGGGAEYQYAAGWGGNRGAGGNGGNQTGCGGGGGSNGGVGGWGRGADAFGKNGTESGGGDGGSGSFFEGGRGGPGFGGGGGGGAYNSTNGNPGGGGGGGGTGGRGGDGHYGGGDGAGPFAGDGAKVANYPGVDGGYLGEKTNGDLSTDGSVCRGSGGGGGASRGSVNHAGGGGGGAGGGYVVLAAEDELRIDGRLLTSGASGGKGGDDAYDGGGAGGGGAGGGVHLRGSKVSVSGAIDALGRLQDIPSDINGGTVKILYIGKIDVAGNISAGRIFTKSIPAMHGLLSPPNGQWTTAKPSLSWNPASNADGDPFTYQLQISRTALFAPEDIVVDYSGFAYSDFKVTTFLPAGEKSWRVRARDSLNAGDWSEAGSFRVDDDLPASRLDPLPGFSRTAELALSWAGSDLSSGISNYTVYVSDNSQNYTVWLPGTGDTSATFSGKEGHNYRFFSVASDVAGNREAPPEKPDAATTIDTTAPVSAVGQPAPYQPAADFDVSWTASDATSGVSYIDIFVSADGGPFTVWKDNMTLDILSATYHGAEGHEYSFYSVARDFAGNVQAVPGPEYIRATRVDGTRPATVFEPGEPHFGSGPVYVTPNTTLYLNATDNFVGVNRTFYVIDARATKEYAGGFNELQPGSHNITYWSVDDAGNTEAQRTARFFVDDRAPVTGLKFNGGNYSVGSRLFIGAQTRMILTGVDTGCGLNRTEYEIDGTGWRLYDGPFCVTSGGDHALSFRSVDNLGQEEAARNMTVFVDVAPPETTAAADSALSNRDIGVMFDGEDDGSGLFAIFYRVTRAGEAETAFREGDGTVIRAAANHSLDGAYTVEYYGLDRVGNAGAVRNLTVTIDTVAELSVNWSAGVASAGNEYSFAGRAEPGATVLVNGAPVAVTSDGGFIARIHLKEGRNRVVVNATDPAGNTAEQTRYVTYQKPPDNTILIVGLVGVIMMMVGIILAARKLSRPPRRQDVPMVESIESRLER